jgi:16S rRNA (guanine527-N7)-methyltransferase
LAAKADCRFGGISVSNPAETVGKRLNVLLGEIGQDPLEPIQSKCFDDYFTLLNRWNARVNLTAIRDQEGILRRHFVESIVCARALPAGISSLLDFGSGAGFPGIPISLCRQEIAVTLAESQGKKAAFLNEVVRVLGISAKVHHGRAELLTTTYDCLVLRAVDKMGEAVQAAAKLVRPDGCLALMSTGVELETLKSAAGEEFAWSEVIPLPGGENRILAMGIRAISSPA